MTSRLISFLGLLSVATSLASGTVVFESDFSTATQAATDAPVLHNGFVAPGFSVSDFTKGAGLGPFRIDDSGASTPAERFLSEPAGSNNSNFSDAFLNDAYIEFSVETSIPAVFTRLDFTMRGHGSAQTGSITVRSSVDDFAADLGTVSGVMNTRHPLQIDLSTFEGFDGATTVTFRFYLYDDYEGQNNRRIGIDAVSLHVATGQDFGSLFGTLVPAGDNRYYADKLGYLEFYSDSWMRHDRIGWMYVEPERFENWVHSVDSGWLFFKSDLLPWYLSGDAGWQYEFAVDPPTPIGEEELRLNPLFTDNMVLQRDRPIRVFGTGTPYATVDIDLAGFEGSATVTENGEWLAELPALAAGFEPLELHVTSGSGTIRLSNILIGDVWLGSGQSNMARPVRGSPAMPVEADNRHHPHVRVTTIAIQASAEPRSEVVLDPTFQSSWQVCSGELIDDFSALGFYFGTYLQRELNMPIGVIISARGATRIESWCSLDTLRDAGVIDADYTLPATVNHNTPSGLYNAMIHPLRDFPLKGVIWYQGEANANQGDPVEYGRVFPAMITAWRDLFGQSEMPFLFVQLAPFRANNAPEGNWPLLREAQADALVLPGTGMAVITDAGEFADIHPQDKQTPGERLALLALELDGLEAVARSPLFDELVIRRDGRCEVHFKHTASGLKIRRVVMNRQANFAPGEDPQAFVVEAESLRGFEIRAADGVWMEANAEIVSPVNGLPDYVEVWSPQVSEPVAVRYGWANFPLCNLYNSAGLPASPFRSDR